jgi:hypothetical protein
VKTATRLRILPPPGFAGLQLGDTEDETLGNIRATATRLSVDSGQDVGLVTRGLGMLAGIVGPSRIRLFGRFAVATAGEPALATLAVTMVPLPRKVTAAGLLRAYRDRNPHAAARLVDLPAGPAIVAAGAGHYRLPPEMTGLPHVLVRPQFVAEIQILAGSLIGLTVSTDSEAGWPGVVAATMRVAASITIER